MIVYKWQVSLILACIFGIVTSTNTITRNTDYDSSPVICGSSDVDCVVNCGADYACSGEVYCSDMVNCNSCVINCNGNYSCSGATIYSNNCTSVSVNVNGDYSLSSSTLHAPNNDGTITITSDSADYGFYNSRVISAIDTYRIKVECFDRHYVDDGSGSYLPLAVCECCNNTIEGSTATLLEFSCQSDTDCASNNLYCPINYYGSAINSCVVSHSNNNVTKNRYYAVKGLDIVE